MSKRVIVVLLFSLLMTLACISMAFEYDRDIAAALLVAIFVIACVGAIVLFIVWRCPVHHGIFFLVWAVALLAIFFAGWADDWFTDSPDEGILANLTDVPAFWFSGNDVFEPLVLPDGTEVPAIPPYGEALAPKGIFQPISTLTDLAFVAAGFAIILLASLGAGKDEARYAGAQAWMPVHRNAAADWNHPLIWGFVLVVIFMGPASMYLHASFRNWGGWMDAFSVYNLGLFGLSYGVYRLLQFLKVSAVPAWIIAIILYVLLAVIFGIIGIDGHTRFYLILAGIIAWVAMELALAILFSVCGSGRHYFIAWWWAITCVLLFAAALTFKLGIEEQAKYATAWQPHGLFHTLAAWALPFVYLYWASERPAKSTG